MNISPELLDQLIKFLAPALPVLMKGGAELGQAVWQKGKDKFADWVMEKLLPQAKQDPDIKEALEDAAEKAEERRARYLKTALEEFFEKYPALAEEGKQILSAGAGSVVANKIKDSNIAVGPGAHIGNVYNYAAPDLAKAEAERQNTGLKRYLTELKKYCYALPLHMLGSSSIADEKTTLDSLYIQLNTDQRKSKDKGKKEGEEAIRRESKEEPITVKEAILAETRLLLIGVAGSGKSASVRRITGMQAEKLLREASDSELPVDLIPAYVELRKFAPRLREVDWALPRAEKRRVLYQAVLEQIKQNARDNSSEDALPLLEEAFHAGKMFIVFDGLDELPAELRERAGLAASAMEEGCRVVVTSRPLAESHEVILPAFVRYTIEPLNRKQIEKFIELWCQEQVRIKRFTTEDAPRRQRNLTQKALGEIPREMTENPMMLTSIALIDRSGTELPKRRVELYQKLVLIFFKNWQEEKEGKNHPPELAELFENESKLTRTLEVLAFETHLANYEAKRAGRQDYENADLSADRAIKILKLDKYLGSEEKAKALLRYMQEKAGLFSARSVKITASEELEETYYSFSHRTIQEYLAGCHLIRSEKRLALYLEKAAQEDFWSPSALLGAEEIIHNQNMGAETLQTLMQHLCLEPHCEQNARALLWSGQMTAEYGMEEIQHNWYGDHAGEYLKKLKDFTLQLVTEARFLLPRERAEAGVTLAKLGDPREGVTKDFLFCRIPPGEFMMGEDEERFKHKIKQEFYMTRYPITQAQFKLFVDAGGYGIEKYWGEAKAAGYWQSGKGFKDFLDKQFRTAPVSFREPFNLPNHPVVGVSWYEAVAYCKWLTEKLRDTSYTLQGTSYKVQVYEPQTRAIIEDANLQSLISSRQFEIRLPKESEWEYAARGGMENQPYPWKGNITPNHANYRETGIGATSAVGLFPDGKNQFGLLDMAGNVWEWCRSLYKPYPYDANDGREDEKASGARVLRGGSCYDDRDDARCSVRNWDEPDDFYDSAGFRVVCSPSSPL